MATIKLNGKTLPAIALTYKVVKEHSDTLGQVVADGLDNLARTKACEDLLLLAGYAQDDVDGSTPGAIMAAALTVYIATHARPEADAPAKEETESVGA